MADCYIIDPDGNLYEVGLYPGYEFTAVKHGKWRNISGAIRLNDEVIPMVQCSECTMMFHLEGHKHIMTYNYCPHCGARMDGE